MNTIETIEITQNNKETNYKDIKSITSQKSNAYKSIMSKNLQYHVRNYSSSQ